MLSALNFNPTKKTSVQCIHTRRTTVTVVHVIGGEALQIAKLCVEHPRLGEAATRFANIRNMYHFMSALLQMIKADAFGCNCIGGTTPLRPKF